MPIWGSVMIDCRVLAVLLVLPSFASAGAWDVFVARCLDPMENLVPPLVEDLERSGGGENAPSYLLEDGVELVEELAPEDGLSACHVVDPSGEAEAPFDAWIAQSLTDERYVIVDENIWHSHLWTEPVLQIEKHRDAHGLTLRILETELDA